MESGVIRHSLYQWSRVGLGNSGRPRGVYRRVPIGRVHGLLGNPLQRWIPVFLPIPLAASRSPSLSQTNCCTFSAATHILPKFCQNLGGRAQAFKEIIQQKRASLSVSKLLVKTVRKEARAFKWAAGATLGSGCLQRDCTMFKMGLKPSRSAAACVQRSLASGTTDSRRLFENSFRKSQETF